MKKFVLSFVVMFLASALRAEGVYAPPSTKVKYDSFANLRNEVLTLIGGATQRILLTTDFLSDGEIVTALYIAQYRKVSVNVLLGSAKANGYMSRLNYLKAQNIPVFLKPQKFTPNHPTALLVDQNLYIINGELDFLAKYRSFEVRVGNDQEKNQYLTAFGEATQKAIPAIPRQIPLVGRPNLNKRPSVYSPSKRAGNIDGEEVSTATPTGQLEGDTFRYSSQPQPKPASVPNKLPKDTMWQKKARSSDQASGN